MQERVNMVFGLPKRVELTIKTQEHDRDKVVFRRRFHTEWGARRFLDYYCRMSDISSDPAELYERFELTSDISYNNNGSSSVLYHYPPLRSAD